jgi:hypothetical protein
MSAATTLKPSKLTIRAYQVGFGDCFLLTFRYPKAAKKADQERHVLIDFGSTGMPDGINAGEQMMKVANDIAERCHGKLHIVVASHRHKDHISGFTTKEDGSGTGDVIAGLKPSLVIQPWTEDPATKDPKPLRAAKSKKGGSPRKGIADEDSAGSPHYVGSLHQMNMLAGAMQDELMNLKGQALKSELAEQIRFLSEDNDLPNRSAVANLAGMGRNRYVNYKSKLNLARLLPGVKATVLGPPTLEQHSEISKQKSADKNEFWMLQGAAQAFWQLQAATGELVKQSGPGPRRLFPDADIYQEYAPTTARWFIRQMHHLRGEQLLGLVRILDKAMNNTSVILLFEVGGKKLLFPGDAQIENWEYALEKDKETKLLEDVYLYKVGHHGSRNATPKTLWNNFSRKGPDLKKKDRIQTVISTMKGKHGHAKSHTEVPRKTLVQELTSLSTYTTTEDAAQNKELFVEVEIPL